MGRWGLLMALLAGGCQVTRIQPRPVATIVDHLCHADLGITPCLKYSETLVLEGPQLLARANAVGFACQGPICERRDDGPRPVRVRLVVEPERSWLEIEVLRGRGESAQELMPYLSESSARLRAELGAESDGER